MRQSPVLTRRWSAIAIAGLTLAFATAWSMRKPPVPTVATYRQLTNDGQQKSGLVSDGLRVYISELVNNRPVLAHVPVTGGTPSPIPLPFSNPGLDASRLPRRSCSSGATSTRIRFRYLGGAHRWRITAPASISGARRASVSRRTTDRLRGRLGYQCQSAGRKRCSKDRFSAWERGGVNRVGTGRAPVAFQRERLHVWRVLGASGGRTRRAAASAPAARLAQTGSGVLRPMDGPWLVPRVPGNDRTRSQTCGQSAKADGVGWRRQPSLPAYQWPDAVQVPRRQAAMAVPSSPSAITYTGEIMRRDPSSGEWVPLSLGSTVRSILQNRVFTRRSACRVHVAYPEATLWRSRVDDRD